MPTLQRSTSCALALAMALGGCSDSGTPAAAYSHIGDRIWVALGLNGLFGHQPCFRTMNGQPAVLPVGECYAMLPPQRMRGVWINTFEGSKFFPDYTGAPPEGARSALWLEIDRAAVSRLTGRQFDPRSAEPEPHAVALDFVGRRTAVAGRYGHMGMSDHYIVVDRILSAQVLD